MYKDKSNAQQSLEKLGKILEEFRETGVLDCQTLEEMAKDIKDKPCDTKITWTELNNYKKNATRVLYRPQRSTLDEAMAEVKEFPTLKDCLEYVGKDFEIDIRDICISYYDYDDRIDWETYIVCDCREETLKEHQSPQALGFLAFKE